MIFHRENIVAIERVTADTNKKLVEAEFRFEKLKEEIAKEKVMRVCHTNVLFVSTRYVV